MSSLWLGSVTTTTSTIHVALYVCQLADKTWADDKIARMAKRKNPAAVALGRRGGKAAAGKAQAARWAGTTADERRAIMRNVIEARWGKAKQRKT